MRSQTYRSLGVFSAWIIIAALVALAGCGGGGQASSIAPVINDKLFTPNYISSLDNLLHWNHLPMKVSFETPTNMAELGWSSSIFTNAADEWNQPGKRALVSVVPYGEPADAVVKFVNRSVFTGGTNATGIAHISYYENSLLITAANIEVCKDDPFRGTLSANDVQFTIAHEIGHALGIHGHSENTSDLMFNTFDSGKQYSPTLRDFNTIMSAYPTYFSSSLQSVKAAPISEAQGPIRTISIE
ncbi:MAG: matrixin family metalloprotease [Armatimonadetes bacterium]|nr:matrixin family metalloprotease [Armatimonadota bacterium]